MTGQLVKGKVESLDRAKLKVIEFLTAQNQSEGPWCGKSNEEQCEFFKKLQSYSNTERIPITVTPEMVQLVKNQINKSYSQSKPELQHLDTG